MYNPMLPRLNNQKRMIEGTIRSKKLALSQLTITKGEKHIEVLKVKQDIFHAEESLRAITRKINRGGF